MTIQNNTFANLAQNYGTKNEGFNPTTKGVIRRPNSYGYALKGSNLIVVENKNVLKTPGMRVYLKAYFSPNKEVSEKARGEIEGYKNYRGENKKILTGLREELIKSYSGKLVDKTIKNMKLNDRVHLSLAQYQATIGMINKSLPSVKEQIDNKIERFCNIENNQQNFDNTAPSLFGGLVLNEKNLNMICHEAGLINENETVGTLGDETAKKIKELVAKACKGSVAYEFGRLDQQGIQDISLLLLGDLKNIADKNAVPKVAFNLMLKQLLEAQPKDWGDLIEQWSEKAGNQKWGNVNLN